VYSQSVVDSIARRRRVLRTAGPLGPRGRKGSSARG
jgi:hypothetical protein